MATGTHNVDMLHGPLTGKIFIFALPLIASGMLQQSFNAVDVAVVGRYTGPEAMAAAGSNGMIISILINLFLGIAIGANVVIANYIGMKNRDGVVHSIATVGMLSIISGIILLVAGCTLARPILEAMSTPEDVIDLAETYLRIYFLGMPFIMAYNFGSAIMRSMGDTWHPFYSLIFAAVVNLILDFAFVAWLGMGIEGVAIATVIANAVNAAFIVYWLMREPAPYTLKTLKIYRGDMVKMLKIGIPAGLQGMIFSTSNIFIQATVNSFGSAAVAGSAAANTYEAYCYYIISSFGAATIAFTGQNYGAGLYDRCKRVVFICLGLGAIISAAANLTISLNDSFFIGLFTDNATVAEFAKERMHTALMFQFIAVSYEITGAFMRGLGWSMTPMLLTIFGTCVLRLLWVFTVTPYHHTFPALLMVYPVTWTVTGILVSAAAIYVAHKAFRAHLPQPD
ncbi:MAG: MATE family efflux transporter [Lachnoclostridium sp.]|nr:MATE family efflux transporter [Lachnoclostridium sp.]